MLIAKNIHKSFKVGKLDLKVLKGVSLTVKEGEFVGLMGSSGSGKSTLLYQLGLLDSPDAGSLILDGQQIDYSDSDMLSRFRLSKLGYIFQDYALVPELTALENVALPAKVAGRGRAEAERAALSLLRTVGLDSRANHLPSELSGGEQQRVSIARSLVNRPKILFADEPCANLDSKSSAIIMNLFKWLNHKINLTIVLVTHEPSDRNFVSRIVTMRDGVIVKK